MQEITFGNFTISKDSPAIIIAEFSDGHEGSFDKAKKLVDAAKAAGADIVKFQMHLPDVEMVAGVKMWAGDLQDILKDVWFSPEKHRKIKEYCDKIGIMYLCTPFSPAATDVLEKIGVAAYKTGSGEAYHIPHHRKLARISAKSGKPVFFSTGMSTMEEIREVVSIYREEGGHVVIMNCTSEYPVRDYSHMRLPLISRFRNEFGVYTGHSDHTTDALTTYLAIALQNAKVIEKHFTLDRNGPFPDDFMSLDPAMFKELVDNVRRLEKDPSILGELVGERIDDALKAMSVAEKNITAEEHAIREWAFHSVVSDKDLKKGDKITLKNVRPARPGWGIPAKFLDEKYAGELLGRTIKKNIPKNTVIYWRDIA